MEIIEKIINGIKVVEVIQQVKPVSDEIKQQRLSVCDQCEFRVKNDYCSQCLCLLIVLTSRSNANCPVGKW